MDSLSVPPPKGFHRRSAIKKTQTKGLSVTETENVVKVPTLGRADFRLLEPFVLRERE